MQLKINGKDQELHFGVRFVRELDIVAGVKQEGISFGFGLTKTLPALTSFDPAVLSDVIYAATITNSPRPSRDDVDNFVDSVEDVKTLEKMFDDVNTEMNKANAIKAALKNMTA